MFANTTGLKLALRVVVGHFLQSLSRRLWRQDLGSTDRGRPFDDKAQSNTYCLSSLWSLQVWELLREMLKVSSVSWWSGWSEMNVAAARYLGL